jgi:hypothetical protein
MSKKNRLRGRESAKQVTLRPWIPKKEREAKRTRNGIAAVLVLTGAVVGGIWMAENRGIGHGKSSDSAPASIPLLPKEILVPIPSESVDQGDWMARVDLPQVEYRPETKMWPKERVDSYFLPKDVPAETVRHFDQVFDHMTGDFLSELKNKKEISDRANFVNYYFTQLFDSAFAEGWNKKSLHDVIAEANKMLIPHGYWLAGDRGVGETYNKYILYKVGSVGSLAIRDGDWAFDAPVVELENPKPILIDPSAAPFDFSAAYWHAGRYMAVDQARIRETMKSVHDYESLCASLGLGSKTQQITAEDMRRMALIHEGMHAAMHHRAGKIPESGKSRALGTVGMGHYALDTANFGPVSNINIGELAANGYGVMNSGESATMTLSFIHTSSRSNPTYLFSDFVILNELLNVPHLNSASKADFLRKLQAGLSDEDFVRAVKGLPTDGARRIGERMAKLGLHLMEK